MYKTIANPLQRRTRSIRERFNHLTPLTQLIALTLLILLILFIRRPLQLIHPDVWVEDGAIYVPDVFTFGFGSIFRPINGYLSVIPRFFTWLSLLFPLEWYPNLSNFLGLLFNIGTFLSVVYFPTLLRNKTLCALSVFLIPIMPEVYILPSYTFWLCSILLILVLLWSPNREAKSEFFLREFIIVFCGLSTPFTVLITPLFLLRSLIFRTRQEFIILATAIAVSLVQLTLVLTTHAQATAFANQAIDIHYFQLILGKFFGYYILSPAKIPKVLNISFLLAGYLLYQFFVAVKAAFQPEKKSNPDQVSSLSDQKNNQILLLLYLLLPIAIFSSVARVPAFMPHPLFAGPRYFFLPYIIISWLLINPPANNPYLKKIGLIILFVALINATSHFVQLQEPLDWAASAREYRTKGEATFLVHYDGKIKNAWFLKLKQHSPVQK